MGLAMERVPLSRIGFFLSLSLFLVGLSQLYRFLPHFAGFLEKGAVSSLAFFRVASRRV